MGKDRLQYNKLSEETDKRAKEIWRVSTMGYYSAMGNNLVTCGNIELEDTVKWSKPGSKG